MDDQLHHPEPRLPQGWKQYHADNIDVTTISDAPTNTATGRHSRSPSVLSNNEAYSMNNNHTVIQPSQIENTNTSTKAAFGMADNDRYLPIMAIISIMVIIDNVRAFGMPNQD